MIPDARRCLENLKGMTRKRFVEPEQISLVHVGLGEREAALAVLEKAEEQQSSTLMNMAIDRRVDPLRSDPRFVALLTRLNLPTLTR